MQRLEVSGAVRLIYRSLGVKGLMQYTNYELLLMQFSPSSCHFFTTTCKTVLNILYSNTVFPSQSTTNKMRRFSVYLFL